MNASLVPDLAHLSVVLATIAVAVSCAGIGVWTGARRAETALLAGWGIAGFAVVAAGTITTIRLSYVLAVLGFAGLAGLVRTSVAFRRRDPDRMDIAMLGRVFGLAIPLFAGIAGMQTIAWDDFTHWLPNLAYLCVHDHFPSLAEPSLSQHAAYPYGLALPGFAVFLLFGLSPDNVALSWNLIMTLAAGASIAHILRHRLGAREGAAIDWTVAAIGLLLGGLACPSFVPKILFSNMADGTTGAVLAVLISMLFDWVDADRSRVGLAIGFAFGCVALVDLRQANGALFGLLILGAMLAGLRQPAPMRTGAIVSLACALVLPLAVLFVWGHYAAEQIPDGQFTIMSVARWRWDELPQIAASMLRVMVAKTGLFALILFLIVRAVLAFRRGDRLAAPERAVLIAGAFVSAGMIGFLGFTYLAADFSNAEALAAASFWRYMSETGPMAVAAVVAVVPLQWWPTARPNAIAIWLAALTVALPIATIKMYRDDLTSSVPELLSMARDVDAIVPRPAPTALVDFTGNGFPAIVVYYEMVLSVRAARTPPRPIGKTYDVRGISPADAAKANFNNVDYVWLAEGAAEMSKLFGPKLGTDCVYLLRRDEASFQVVRRWPAGRYKWITFSNGWTAASDPDCR